MDGTERPARLGKISMAIRAIIFELLALRMASRYPTNSTRRLKLSINE